MAIGMDLFSFFHRLSVFLPCCLLVSSSNRNRWGLCFFRGVPFLPIGVVGGHGSVDRCFRCKQGKAFCNRLIVTPPVTVGVEAEAPVARQSLEDSAVAVVHDTAGLPPPVA